MHTQWAGLSCYPRWWVVTKEGTYSLTSDSDPDWELISLTWRRFDFVRCDGKERYGKFTLDPPSLEPDTYCTHGHSFTPTLSSPTYETVFDIRRNNNSNTCNIQYLQTHALFRTIEISTFTPQSAVVRRIIWRITVCNPSLSLRMNCVLQLCWVQRGQSVTQTEHPFRRAQN
jgi:hypothetical protein